uniref:Uncharacterized protein n=1 Tax=Arundo donax TaxID=35708 RepID=A0A0A9FTH5_ARUDO
MLVCLLLHPIIGCKSLGWQCTVKPPGH